MEVPAWCFLAIGFWKGNCKTYRKMIDIVLSSGLKWVFFETDAYSYTGNGSWLCSGWSRFAFSWGFVVFVDK